MTTDTSAIDDDTVAAFTPQSHAVSFNEQTIEIQPLSVLQVIKISRSLKQVLPALDRIAPLLAEGELGVDEVGLLVQLLADYGEPLTEAVAVATGLALHDIQGSHDMAGLISVIAAIVRVNTDFFAQQAVPHLAGLRSAAAANGAGPTPSTRLSAQATF